MTRRNRDMSFGGDPSQIAYPVLRVGHDAQAWLFDVWLETTSQQAPGWGLAVLHQALF